MTILRVGRHMTIPPLLQVQTFAPRSAAVAAGWWVVAGKTCVAAYQPKGAASYVASKSNLANPGTLDATDGAAYPTWDTSTGWTFNGSTQYLLTGVVPTNVTTALCQFTMTGGPADRGIFGTRYANVWNVLWESPNWYFQNFSSGVSDSIASFTSGNIGMSGVAAYKNGTSGDTWARRSTLSASDISIGAVRINATDFSFHYGGSITAFAVYSDELSDAEVATVAAAMAAL